MFFSLKRVCVFFQNYLFPFCCNNFENRIIRLGHKQKKSDQITFSHTGYCGVPIFKPTVRGNYKLVYDGYQYYKSSRQANGVQSWRCLKFTGNSDRICYARAHTKRFGLFDRVRVSGLHNHAPNM